MKILLCLHKDIFSEFALNLIAPALRKCKVIIIFSDGVGKHGEHLNELKELESSAINKGGYFF